MRVHSPRLQLCSSTLDESTLNGTRDVRREYRSSIERTGDRLLPRPKHLLHPSSCTDIDRGVRIHKRPKELLTEVERVGSTYVLDNRVEDVQCGELLLRNNLEDYY